MNKQDFVPNNGTEEPTWDTLVDNNGIVDSTTKPIVSPSERFDLPKKIEALAPGVYTVELVQGKKVEGIPGETYVTIHLGSKDKDTYFENYSSATISGKIKTFNLHKDSSGKYLISTGIEDTEEQKKYWKENPHVERLIENGYRNLEIKEGEEVILGREFNEDSFPISDEFSRVSRKHLAIRLKNGMYTLEDLNSSNGSYAEFTINKPKEEPLPTVKI